MPVGLLWFLFAACYGGQGLGRALTCATKATSAKDFAGYEGLKEDLDQMKEEASYSRPELCNVIFRLRGCVLNR